MPSTAATHAFKGPYEMVRAAQIARLFYFERHSKVHISGLLGISRFDVARLLDLARASGMVQIAVNEPGSLDVDLSAALCHRFGLHHAVVVRSRAADDVESREQIGRAAADLLSEICGPEDVIGIGWARIVLAMAEHVHDLKARRIVQVTGALTRPDVDASAPEVVRKVARRVGAESSVFYAPMLVSDAQTALGLYRQEQVATAVAHFGSVTKAIVGVGGWDPPHSTLYDALTPQERLAMTRSGVFVDLAGVLLDVDGQDIQTPLSDRIIAITAQQLARVPEVIGLAYGVDKVPAARAALRGGYLQGLVTHTAFAEALLSAS
ncbi:MAG: sugar-binding domain-containing protein [Ornithinimicrobium sp.]